MLRLRNSRGQIIVPAMFLLPTLFIFVFLLYETAKLSRIKIRHQFAIDAALFVEMTNYSDFLNRSAYVNGAFPMRIFYEGFNGTDLCSMGGNGCSSKIALDDALYDDGVFPRPVSAHSSQTNNPQVYMGSLPPDQWKMSFGGPRAATMNTYDPQPSGTCTVDGQSFPDCVEIISMNTAKNWNVNWDDANQIYKLYVQIYQLLGSVESAQYKVLDKLQTDHTFLKKSYWLNTGGSKATGESQQLVVQWKNNMPGGDWKAHNAIKFHCTKNVSFHGNQLVHQWGQPYQIWAANPPPAMPDTGIGECDGGPLFQVVTVDKNNLDKLSHASAGTYPGFSVSLPYFLDPESNSYENYFHVDLQSEANPQVHASIALGGFNGAKPGVWAEGGSPAPTPKFQVREYP